MKYQHYKVLIEFSLNTLYDSSEEIFEFLKDISSELLKDEFSLFLFFGKRPYLSKRSFI